MQRCYGGSNGNGTAHQGLVDEGAAAQALKTKVYAADRKVYMYEVRMRERPD